MGTTPSVHNIRMGRNIARFKHTWDVIHNVSRGREVHVLGTADIAPYEKMAEKFDIEIEWKFFKENKGLIIRKK
jgi:activator of HSP90 ATPase